MFGFADCIAWTHHMTSFDLPTTINLRLLFLLLCFFLFFSSLHIFLSIKPKLLMKIFECRHRTILAMCLLEYQYFGKKHLDYNVNDNGKGPCKTVTFQGG